MDPIVGTGSAAMMAIRVLLDHDVKEDKIILVSLLMAECGSQGKLELLGLAGRICPETQRALDP